MRGSNTFLDKLSKFSLVSWSVTGDSSNDGQD
jgi:hypothetical protein